MAPFRVWSKVCITPIHVKSKLADFVLHMDRDQCRLCSTHERALLRTWSRDIVSGTKNCLNCTFCQMSKRIVSNHLYLGSLYDIWRIQIFLRRVPFMINFNTSRNIVKNKRFRLNRFQEQFPFLTVLFPLFFCTNQDIDKCIYKYIFIYMCASYR